ncbi:hypothetical protein MED01_005686 [Micromonospora sp. MED01]|uniref:hypothetical protein n=1 Tax=Micromonospora alfalfae TaxID=2911212 RepID=UPI001EE79AF9|nr:hypothetical protein [Micromonospora alfalfae]MCG5466647.1 hypothetical protein [Micromonospora alfalfae]
MTLTDGAVIGHTEELISEHAKLTGDPNAGLGKIARYLRGEHDLPNMPRGAKAEYRSLARAYVTPRRGSR